MRRTSLANVIFAASFAGFGALSLVSGDSTLLWELFPAWSPWRDAIADASGFMYLVGGLGMLHPRTSRLATLVITGNVLLWLLLLGIPRVVAQPTKEVMWLKVGQSVMLLTGGWILAVRSAPNARGRHLACILYAVALPMVGLSHFVYIQASISFVPAWLPYKAGVAYLTGAAHIAAGLGILFGVLPRLAATAEAMMISIFAVLACVPGVATSPGSRSPWARLLITAMCAGAAWAIAGSLQGAKHPND